MIDDEGCHPQPRRIADAKLPRRVAVQRHRLLAASATRHVFDKIEHEGPDKVDNQHLRLEGRSKLGPLPDARVVHGPELA